MPGQRVGLMGGSFNPPHEGHVAIAEAALKRLKLDRVWWLVTPGNPLKTHDGLPPLADRVAACRRLVRDRRIEVTGFEAGLGSSYTAATLAYLRTRHPGVRFVWIMGADNLASFHRWRAWRSIISAVPVAVMDRPGWRFRGSASITAKAYERCRLPENAARTLATRKPPAWTFLTVKLSASSSTALRAKHRGAASSGRSQGS